MEVYAGLLAAVLEDDMITPEEHDRLGAYRAKHAISQAQHNAALEELGWSLSMYSSKLLQGSELDAYTHVLHRILEDDRVDPEEEERLEAYRLDADPYEDNDRSVELPETERKRVLHRMRAWLRAMHEFWSVGTIKRTAPPVPTWAIYWAKHPKGGAEGQGGPP